jgi:hypothetical protein
MFAATRGRRPALTTAGRPARLCRHRGTGRSRHHPSGRKRHACRAPARSDRDAGHGREPGPAPRARGETPCGMLAGLHNRRRARNRPELHSRGRRRPGSVRTRDGGGVRRPDWRGGLPVRGSLLRIHIYFVTISRAASAWACGHPEITGTVLSRSGALRVGIDQFGNCCARRWRRAQAAVPGPERLSLYSGRPARASARRSAETAGAPSSRPPSDG